MRLTMDPATPHGGLGSRECARNRRAVSRRSRICLGAVHQLSRSGPFEAAVSLGPVKDEAPADIKELAQARAAARVDRDWPEADRLRAEIETAGWKVVDQGTHYRLERIGPADVVEGERVRYGRSASVPSRLADPTTAPATVVLQSPDDPADLVRTFDGLRRHVPDRTQVVVVTESRDEAAIDALDATGGPAGQRIGGEPPEVVWTVEQLGLAAATNAGIRRATGEVVVLLDPRVELTGDAVGPLVGALADPSVAIVGAWGRVSVDLRRWDEAPPGDVDVIELALMAFRRADIVARGPLDERLRTGQHLATWWSLVLRDEGEDGPPRRAVRVGDLPIVRHERPADRDPATAEQARLEKRDFYRVLDRFGRRRDLLRSGRAARGLIEA